MACAVYESFGGEMPQVLARPALDTPPRVYSESRAELKARDDTRRWSARRTIAFIILASLLLWGLAIGLIVGLIFLI